MLSCILNNTISIYKIKDIANKIKNNNLILNHLLTIDQNDSLNKINVDIDSPIFLLYNKEAINNINVILKKENKNINNININNEVIFNYENLNNIKLCKKMMMIIIIIIYIIFYYQKKRYLILKQKKLIGIMSYILFIMCP